MSAAQQQESAGQKGLGLLMSSPPQATRTPSREPSHTPTAPIKHQHQPDNSSAIPFKLPMTSQDHCSQRYVLLKKLGEGDNGLAFAAVSKADARRIITQHQNKESQALYDEMRSSLVVVKFAKADNVEGDLANEIDTLMNKLDQHPRITHGIDAYARGPIQWLALPYCNGGDLLRFMDEHPKAMTLPFRWHVAAQLMEAVMFLQYGVRDLSSNPYPTPVPGWLPIEHGDIFDGNVLLRPAPSSETGFPDVMLADFGRARRFLDGGSDGGAHHQARMEDIAQLRNIMDARLEWERITVAASLRPACGHRPLQCPREDLYDLSNTTDSLANAIFLISAAATFGLDGIDIVRSNIRGHGGIDNEGTPSGDLRNGEDGEVEDTVAPVVGTCKQCQTAAHDSQDPLESFYVIAMAALHQLEHNVQARPGIFSTLVQFHRLAVEQRARSWRPMSGEAAAWLSRPVVSNEEIYHVLDRQFDSLGWD